MQYGDKKAAQQAMLEAALAYAEGGWYVFAAPWAKFRDRKTGALKTDKRGLFSATYAPPGFEPTNRQWDSTRDPKRIIAQWRKYPRANIGVVCGAMSGRFIIEADTESHPKVAKALAAGIPAGIPLLRQLEAEYGPLPPPFAESPSGGLHYRFRHPGFHVTSKESVLGIGIDCKGDGPGMIIAPPSIRDGVPYRLLNDLDHDAPDWILDQALAGWPKRVSSKGSRSPSPGGAARTDGERVTGHASPSVPFDPTPVPGHVCAEHAGRGVWFDDDNEVLFALTRVPPHEVDGDEWFKIGRVLFDHFAIARRSEAEGLEAFDDWSDWGREQYPDGRTPREQWAYYRRYPRRPCDGDERVKTTQYIFDLADEYTHGQWRQAFEKWKRDHGES
jgi:hypothetical protein